MSCLNLSAQHQPSTKTSSSVQARAVKRLVPGKDQVVLQQLESLEKRLFKKADSWTGLFSKEAVRRNCVLLYVTHDSQVAAYIVYTTNGLAAHIAKLAVRDNLRRQGIGRSLVRAAVETARRERRVGSCSLHVDPGNTAAVGLYRSLGFAVEAELQDYYAPGRSAYKMRLELD
ncbi:hypothetical protein N2152v2_002808 [Parachlorella kessleri]